jgi:hypothetical protein
MLFLQLFSRRALLGTILSIGSFVHRLISQYETRGSATSKAPIDAGLFSLQLGRAERTTLYGSQEFIVDPQLAAGAWEVCLATMVANCVRRPIFSFRKTLRRWNSTVFVLRNSWLAISRLECPRATASAT